MATVVQNSNRNWRVECDSHGGSAYFDDELRILQSETQPSSKPRHVAFPWFALQVRTRNEAGVADQLGGQGYEWFLPLYKERKRWSDRIKEVKRHCSRLSVLPLQSARSPSDFEDAGSGPDCGFQPHGPWPWMKLKSSALQTMVAPACRNQPWPFLKLAIE